VASAAEECIHGATEHALEEAVTEQPIVLHVADLGFHGCPLAQMALVLLPILHAESFIQIVELPICVDPPWPFPFPFPELLSMTLAKEDMEKLVP